MLENMAIFLAILYVLLVGIAGLLSVFIFNHVYNNSHEDNNQKRRNNQKEE